MDEMTSAESSGAIAIIGVAGRFPGAKDVQEFWRNLRDGVESVRVDVAAPVSATGGDLRVRPADAGSW